MLRLKLVKKGDVGLWIVEDVTGENVTNEYLLRLGSELVLGISFEKLTINNVVVDGDELTFLNFHIFNKNKKLWECISTLGTGRLRFFAESSVRKVLIGIKAEKKEFRKNRTFWDFLVVEYKGNKLNGEYEECNLFNTATDEDISFEVEDDLLNIDF
jgi:hypothetical protein